MLLETERHAEVDGERLRGYLGANALAQEQGAVNASFTIVDGKPVMKDRKITTIDEDALRREVVGLMKHFIVDYDAVVKSREHALPHMLAAHRRVWSQNLPLQRFIARTR